MHIRTLISTTLAAVVIAPVIAFAAQTVIQTGPSDAGAILTDGAGFSLYTFDKDTAAVSNCNDDCAVKWPPLMASDSSRPSGEFGIITRTDGSLQWAYKGEALYTWFKDEAAGDITGDGVKTVWHLARP